MANCVGYFNYKYFILFIFGATLGCHTSSILCISQLYYVLTGKNENSNPKFQTYQGKHSEWMMINSLLTVSFGLTLTFFTSFHLLLVFKGATTIEFGSQKRYTFGWKKNFQSVMGVSPLYWFIPIKTTSGDGYEFCDNQSLLDPNDSDTDSDSE